MVIIGDIKNKRQSAAKSELNNSERFRDQVLKLYYK